MRRLLIIVCGLLMFVSCAQKEYRQNSNFVFGTIYNITYQSDKDLQQEIEAELMKVDGEFSMFNPQSTVARINSGDSTVERSEMFNEIYQLAQTVSKETDGAFDITVAPLVNAWGFGFKHEQLPTPEQVDSLLQLRNQMDFSAIAKGYGCDVVARLLESHGIHNYMVEIGGEVVVSGKNAKGDDWHIGITKPTEDSLNVEGEMQTVLSITDHAMATSGNYRNFYYQGGRKYAHTIDPRTGYPVEHQLLSATVIAETSVWADALASICMAMGMERSLELIRSLDGVEAYYIFVNGHGELETYATEGFQTMD